MTTGNEFRCTWPEPSRDGRALCHAVGRAWWFDAWGARVVRCAKHYREAAANAARALGWEVHES